jgi:hypothetical protein
MEEHRLRVLENRMLRRLFGLKRAEVTGSRWESQKIKDHWEDQDVGVWTIL